MSNTCMGENSTSASKLPFRVIMGHHLPRLKRYYPNDRKKLLCRTWRTELLHEAAGDKLVLNYINNLIVE